MRCKQLSCVNVLSTRDMQFLNALLPIISTDVGISIETNEVHPLNEKSPIDFRFELSSKEILVNDRQFWNAEVSMVSTFGGNYNGLQATLIKCIRPNCSQCSRKNDGLNI